MEQKMKISKQGIDLIAHFEGVRYKPYKCGAGLWTVGIGHLIGDGKSLPDDWNRKLTKDEVYGLFATDVARFERGVERYCPVRLTQGQFDCLCSFAFNHGLGLLQRSSVRQKVNRGDFEGAVESLLQYNKAKDPKTGVRRVLKGLDLRRKAEAALFMSK
jgi:lysozyme